MVTRLLAQTYLLLSSLNFFGQILKKNWCLYLIIFSEMAEFDNLFSFSSIYLIPKMGCSSSLDDFRPISLLGWVHKLVTQVLAARLKGVIGKLVWDTQPTFIRWRNVFEGWSITSKMVDEMKRTGEGVVFKMDFKKAYDCVD